MGGARQRLLINIHGNPLVSITSKKLTEMYAIKTVQISIAKRQALLWKRPSLYTDGE
ncbi:hypothetical protein EV11_1111 [Prochlorococcus sp. SS52]|uniref:hypothetical protein n=1 Tax=Prochlorococcus marinus TaxID=1219 RepID=UPI0002FE3C7D|nr:hypothetical protein [Prochlorococcus marinus]KGG14428.1 hypothetical protein EV04_0005 [Prochlorococcus marinus str. LG]KGG22582.1 hypothetical protein EV08_0097 [Prochlorococcus marinus str. SS2]KGG24425.1 hypothetical protein EV09_0332 [Prochlorococcus marinus str. SS35]KGG35837.1 hypothetical protein EV11_1111 [Prochlorococcus sp. SS52]KGG34198.1 hypothetical protein EV10_0044 [Prochlorococcus marinus str. SS51]